MADIDRSLDCLESDLPVIPVVVSAGDQYSVYAGVTLLSVMKHASQAFFYDLVILDGGISDCNKRKLVELLGPFENAAVRFVNLVGAFDNASTRIHFATSSYYRLLIPELLSGYEKAIYLDCDVIVKDDISKLYSLPGRKSISAAPSIGIIRALAQGRKIKYQGSDDYPFSRYFTEKLGLAKEEFQNYINSGVIVFNISKILRNWKEIKPAILHHVEQEYFLLDQDILNIVFKNDIDFLPIHWNFQNPSLKYSHLPKSLMNSYREARDNPGIIHYVTGRKPWNNTQIKRAGEFWKYCRMTPFYDEILKQFQEETGFTVEEVFSEIEAEKKAPENPRVSIVIPVYNDERELDRCVKSILDQDERNLEIIMVDDSSSDYSIVRMDLYAQRDARFRVLQKEVNGGSGPARNAGLEIARGEYVRFCDANDRYPKHSLGELIDAAETSDADIAGGNLVRYLEQDNRIRQRRNHPEYIHHAGPAELGESPEISLPVHHHRYLYRRTFLIDKQIDYPALMRGQDPVMLAKAFLEADRIYLIPTVVYIHHIPPIRKTLNFVQARDVIQHFEEVYKLFSDEGHAHIGFLHLMERFRVMSEVDIASFEPSEKRQIATAIHRVLGETNSELVNFDYKPHQISDTSATAYRAMRSKSVQGILEYLKSNETTTRQRQASKLLRKLCLRMILSARKFPFASRIEKRLAGYRLTQSVLAKVGIY